MFRKVYKLSNKAVRLCLQNNLILLIENNVMKNPLLIILKKYNSRRPKEIEHVMDRVRKCKNAV